MDMPSDAKDLNELLIDRMAKGDVLCTLGRLEEAIGAYDEAITVANSQLSLGPGELAKTLATLVSDKAAALEALGKNEEAIDCADKAIALCRYLPGPPEQDLATSLTTKGSALQSLGCPHLAIHCYREAIGILKVSRARELLPTFQCHAAARLSFVLSQCALALARVGKYPEALPLASEALDLWEDVLASDRARWGYEWPRRELRKVIEKTRWLKWLCSRGPLPQIVRPFWRAFSNFRDSPS